LGAAPVVLPLRADAETGDARSVFNARTLLAQIPDIDENEYWIE
jgi:hypothetical protein